MVPRVWESGGARPSSTGSAGSSADRRSVAAMTVVSARARLKLSSPQRTSMGPTALVLLALALGAAVVRAQTGSGGWRDEAGFNTSAVLALVARVLGPSVAANVQVVSLSDPPAGAVDAFAVYGGGPGSPLTLAATSAVAAASGLRHYLIQIANCSVGWAGSQLFGVRNASTLPAVGSDALRGSTAYRWRHWGNVVTVSYSGAWWDWPRWEREIDLMALRGYNLAPAFTGQEAIWARVLARFGMTAEDLATFFTGPGFLAWGGPRMGNIQGWQGPLSPAWLAGQEALNQRIVARLRELGITPALPMFAGHVPKNFAERNPGANVTETPTWAGFNSTWSSVSLLVPTDPLFSTIVAATVAEVNASVGIGAPGQPHVWQFDTYNELLPASNDTTFLRQLSSQTFGALRASDPDAVWELQGWMFTFDPSFWQPAQIQAYLSGVPQGRLLVMDLDAYLEPAWPYTQGFFGQDFLWGMINDGGGRMGLFGNLSRIQTGPAEAFQAYPANMVGVIMAPEAIGINPVDFELLHDGIFTVTQRSRGHSSATIIPARVSRSRDSLGVVRHGFRHPDRAGSRKRSQRTQPSDASSIAAWLATYSRARYGLGGRVRDAEAIEALQAAWGALWVGAYDDTGEHSASLVEQQPALGMDPGNEWGQPALIVTAFRQMARAVALAPELVDDFDGALAAFDVVDVGRQVLVNTFGDLLIQLTGSSWRADAASAHAVGAAMLAVLQDLNSLLASHPSFLLGGWTEAARQLCGQYDANIVASCVENAKWQITLWGALAADGTGAVLEGYAVRQWAHLTSTLYVRRWSEFIELVVEAAAHGNATINQTAWAIRCTSQDVAWATDTATIYPVVPVGNLSLILPELLTHWGGDEAGLVACFVPFPDMDGYGQITQNPLQVHDPGQLAALCLLDPACGGFNNNGWLKPLAAAKVPFAGATYWERVPGCH